MKIYLHYGRSPVELNAPLPSATQIVKSVGKIIVWDVDVNRSANLAFKGVSVLEDASAQKHQLRKERNRQVRDKERSSE